MAMKNGSSVGRSCVTHSAAPYLLPARAVSGQRSRRQRKRMEITIIVRFHLQGSSAGRLESAVDRMVFNNFMLIR